MSIYVETRIRAPLDELWRGTQEPVLHERWDLRFSEITLLPHPGEALPQRFHYATRLGFGLRIRGVGESAGTRDGEGGECTSALRFRSDDPKSLIREGSGYWRYVPTDDGIRFLTWYDYRTRFGSAGRAFDAVVFRPLMRWATAWSFDRLRLWLERDVPPELSLQRAVTNAVARLTLALVFAWHGLVPKILARHPEEAAMLAEAGVPARWLDEALLAIGIAELAWAAALVALWRSRWPFAATIAAMLLALVVVALRSPHRLEAPFSPVTLNVAVAALALVGWIACRDLPSAARCLYRRPVETPVEERG